MERPREEGQEAEEVGHCYPPGFGGKSGKDLKYRSSELGICVCVCVGGEENLEGNSPNYQNTSHYLWEVCVWGGGLFLLSFNYIFKFF